MIGMSYWMIIHIGIATNRLRNNLKLLIHFFISILLTFMGIKYFPLYLSSNGNSNGAAFLFAPIILVGSYILLRFLYIKAYKMEPVIA